MAKSSISQQMQIISEDAALIRRQSTLLPGLQRMTTRSQLIRQSSAAVLRQDQSPSRLRQASGINIFPEADADTDVEIYYHSGWDAPHLHFHVTEGGWTTVPGVAMERAVDLSMLPKFEGADGVVWYLRIPTTGTVELVPNDNGKQWDKAPGDTNYVLDGSGRYFLRNGKVEPLVPPPEKPALLRAESVGSTEVKLVWNPPIVLPSVVAGYNVYRGEELIVSVGGDVAEHFDKYLMGLCDYSYTVRATNKLNQEGPPSDTCTIRTGEPGKPSAPRGLHCTRYCQTSVVLVWSVPVDHGGAPVKYYRIYRDDVPIATVPSVTDVSQQWTDETVQSSVAYTYTVSASHHRPTDALRIPITRDFTSFNIVAPPTGMSTPEALEEGGPPQRKQPAAAHHPVSATKEAMMGSEGALSEPLEVKAVQMLELPRLDDRKPHIILQTFNWQSCFNPAGWYKILNSKIEKMADCNITMAWMGPPSESVSGQGYMPTRWYNLNSCYGSEDELIELNGAMRDKGVTPMLDLVINHRCGTKQDSRGQWTVFEDPPWENWAIVSNNLQGYQGGGVADTGEQSECAPDIDHTNEKVREDVKLWTSWLFNDVGFGALRLDMAPGYNVKCQVEYVQNLGSPFTVGEYWNGNAGVLQNYVGGGANVIAAYDFALYYALRKCVESNNFEGMRENGKLNGFVGRDPQKSVTFLDNHDTEHLDFVGKFAGGNGPAILRGYALLLTHPGVPCIYWNHWSDYGEQTYQQLKELCQVRTSQGIHCGSGVHIARAEWGLYAAFISRDRHCGFGGGSVAVKIGSNDWHPGGGWEKVIAGDQYCVWTK
eukprot:GHVS01080351.1.p1 GENE.GHVS01080351.1~~GHVS01080351.1.p1  ORF type:complete len:822 (-),score=115.13 GHVS01080351.1:330-2795(-)